METPRYKDPAGIWKSLDIGSPPFTALNTKESMGREMRQRKGGGENRASFAQATGKAGGLAAAEERVEVVSRRSEASAGLISAGYRHPGLTRNPFQFVGSTDALPEPE
ncbi:hypothetical protein GCM10011335_00390 [Aureimonas glaciei]|uniref:Uncharacterized protein n=1 Tax=Aureimonas glaciei TaxID=1776957 RepID=A0A916V198_9HYPH|nr:hypothetical protein GCM10011335_00390 [Aureimonas glaciei]